jgi:hypothetical protein
MDFSTEDANRRSQEILSELQDCKQLRKELDAAGVRDAARQECVFGIAAGFPWKQRYPKPAEVKARNDELSAAIAKFSAAAEKFERRSGATLLSVNDALRDRQDWEPALSAEEDRVLRRAPEVRLFEYLEMVRQRVDEGSYGATSHVDPQIDTPTGTLPRKPSSLASWLSIRALQIARAKPGAAFNRAAATCATILCGETVNEATIATMLQQEAAAKKPEPHG